MKNFMQRKMKNRKIIAIVIIAFIAGITFAGGSFFIFAKGKVFVKKVISKLEEKRIANMPRAKESLLLFDFENREDLSRWNLNNASIEISKEHVTSGKYSAKLVYSPSRQASAVMIEKYFKKNKNLTNWAPYEIISFDIFNPSNKQERMILQIKDKNEKRAKINLQLNPNAVNHIEVDIRQLWDSLNPSEIGQFNLLLWNNDSEKIFYLDNLQLIPLAAFEKHGKSILDEEFIPKPGEKIYAAGDYFAFDNIKWIKTDVQTDSSFVQAPLIINNYIAVDLKNLNINGGIPLPFGQLKSLDNLALIDVQGNAVPFQAKILSYWPDKSIKWLLLVLNSDLLLKEQKAKYFLRYGGNIKRSEFASFLNVKETPDEVIVDTGKIKFSLSKNSFYLFNNLWLGNKLISAKGDLVLVHNRKEYHSCLDKEYKLSIEERGPIRACLRAKGWFVSAEGEKFCQFIVRIYAYKDLPYLKIQHTFIYTGYPENKIHYLYKGKNLPKNETIDAIYIRTPFNITEGAKFTFAADGKVMQSGLSGADEFIQDKFNNYRLSKNGKVINSGNKLDGWLDVSSPEEGIAIGVKNFWQQFPKEFFIDKQKKYIITYLWPGQAGELDLKTTEAAYGPDSDARGSAFGLAKTHEIFFYLHNGDYQLSGVKQALDGLCSDIVLMASPEWVCATKVLGRIWPFDKRLGAGEECLSRLFDWGARQIENFAWYGMVDFGDTMSWYRQEDDDNTYTEWGWHPIGRWGWFNCEGVGTHTGSLIQFLRTEDYKYFKFGANLARHIMDIDTCHYNTVANDRRLKGIIPDDYSQLGSMHRHNGNHWGGENDEASHTNILGLTLYYYITGDERAKDVMDEVGNFFLNERITYFRHPDIAPHRAIANVLWGDINLYEMTGDERYKKAADKLANLFYKGQKHDGAWVDNYNPVHDRWDGKNASLFMRNYTLPALIEYHKLTGNKAIAECIIKATDFMMKNEEYAPYFVASAYSYWLTGDKKYLENVRNKLDFVVSRQKVSEDPIWDGMIYLKAYYLRSVEFLYNIPFAFEALVDGTKKQ